eukprot:jgi/Ulvmu1/10338/UM061_0021.1
MAVRRSARNKKAVNYAPTAPAKAQASAAPKPSKAAAGVAKTAAKTKAAQKNKSKRGLSGHVAPKTDQALGRVDPASGLTGGIHVDDAAEVYDVMLNLVDLAKNHDKYFILQLVDCGGEYAVFTRWGRTGTAGSCKTDKFAELNAALSEFATKFDQKTGASWADREHYARKAGKYLWVQKDHAQERDMWAEAPKWQYWVDDGVDGKADGWYDYTEEGSDVTEQLFHEWTFHAGLHERLVASGVWEYRVDLLAMTQTNAAHAAHKTRHIRRWTPQLGADQTPPAAIKEEAKEEEEEDKVVAPKTPSPQKRKRGTCAAATPVTTPPAPAAKAAPRAKGRGKAAAVKVEATPTKAPAVAPHAAASPAKTKHAVDPVCPVPGATVHEDFSAMLNQTNVGANNNKFYRLQLLEANGKFYVWTRWGRVGENGQSKQEGPLGEDKAASSFRAKFRSKTLNDWDERHSFTPAQGKYDLVDVEGEEADEPSPVATPAKKVKREAVPASTLDAATQELVALIFSEDMFNSAMADMELDTKKMPLGALSQAQVQKGYAVLAELEDAIKARSRPEIERLTGRFYTVIPHSFGRQRPPLIDTTEKLQAKFEMCDVLADIETAQEMLKGADEGPAATVNPLDEQYASLQAALRPLLRSDKKFAVLERYCSNTLGHGGIQLQNVWSVDSEKDGAAFAQHRDLPNHKLLWHGTNVAVVAAILKSGLRIMPHSGGRVGRGIYLASEHSKSAGYVRPGRLGRSGKHTGVMFLVQAALGEPCEILCDDGSLKTAPKGYHSVLAKGQQEPDPKKDTKIKIEGVDVAVPQGKPVPQPGCEQSLFSQSEYLVYQESQQRLRYVLTFTWGY